MRLLLASSEVNPYSKSGGLADMVGALAKALGRAGHQVGVVTPLYRGIHERIPDLKRLDWWIDLPLGRERLQAEVFTIEPSPGVTIYFVSQPSLYLRDGLYGEAGRDYPDNARRFVFFSKCVAQLARYLPWKPQLVHVHDWQAGLVPLLIRHQHLADGWLDPPRTCLTIHNLAYQGIFPRADYELTNLPWDYFTPAGVEFYALVNSLKAGIVYADLITTVSPRYAREITTEEYGCALDPILRQRQASLVGMLNGVDYDEWNTTDNPHLKQPYSVQDLSGKAVNKAALQAEMGLPVRADVPLFGNITRLAEQKGVDIQLGALEEMLAADMQFVLLGSGAPQYERAYQSLALRHRGKVSVRIGFNAGLSHRIEAGSDFFLMPSRFEPCGLNQLYSLRYGTVPLVRVTGGLDDSVVDMTENAEQPTGIKFREYAVRALAKAIRKGLVLFQTPDLLHFYRQNGMTADFSWDRTTREYQAVFARIGVSSLSTPVRPVPT